ERDTSLDVAHSPVEPDQALAQRRLPAARLARDAHDLAVRDREGDAVERVHVTRQRAVVDAEVVDREAHLSRNRGLKTSSRPTMAVIARPGGMNHHHIPSWRALFETAMFSISPSDITCEGPSPRKSSVAAIRIELPNSRMKTRKRYELMFDAISWTMICQLRL